MANLQASAGYANIKLLKATPEMVPAVAVGLHAQMALERP